jgi:hypothetical protein
MARRRSRSLSGDEKKMKTLKLFLALSLTLPLFSQQQIFTTSSPTPPTLLAQLGGSASQAGNVVLNYVVIANFVGGSVPSNIVTIPNGPNTLSSTNLIALQWSPVAGATTYDVLKLTSASLPSGSNSVALHTGLTTTFSTDTGSGLSSYTIGTPPVNATVVIDLNSRDYVTPQFEIAGQGSKPGFAVNLVVTNLWSNVTNATATGVTIPAAQVVNGLFTHSPTGAVNDTTDTATNLIAALPSCTATSTTGTSFVFSVLNTSASAVAITVLGGTNVTVVGTATVAQNAVRNFRGIVTACTGTPAVSLYSLGGGAF